MAEPAARHSLATLTAEGWAQLMARRPELREEPLAVRWAQAGWPLVVRRPACDEDPRRIPLGLPLPPSAGKRRIALAVDPEQIAAVAPPILLVEVADSAPAHWRPAIARLLDLDRRTRVFGGLGWAHLTGLAYLSATSDLDLLWELPAPPAAAAALLGGIAAIAGEAPMRIDGEVLGPAGGVQWRELLAVDGEVLVKTATEVRAIGRADFLAGAVR